MNVSQKMKTKTTDVVIHAIQRTGSNHLQFNLHVQPGFFTHSERVMYPQRIGHDVLGRRGPKVDARLNSSTYTVWKAPLKRQDPNRLNSSLAMRRKNHDVHTKNRFHFRHPYTTWQSWLSRSAYLSSIGRSDADTWDVSADHIVNLFVDQFKLFGKLNEHHLNSNDVTFHEAFLKGPDALLTTVRSLTGDVDRTISTTEEYIDTWFNGDPPEGYGEYDAKRVITYEDELNKLSGNMDVAQYMVNEVCRAAKRHCYHEWVQVFHDFYTKMHRDA